MGLFAIAVAIDASPSLDKKLTPNEVMPEYQRID
jgi:hypothetical protein